MKIIIVNENDEVIGVKERSELDYATDIFRTSALWLTNSKGETLLAKRSMSKDKDPGMWGPAVAGTNDEGETYEDNIVKEAKEEIGLEGVEFMLGPKMFARHVRSQWIQWYLATIDRDPGEFTMEEGQVDELAWVSIDKIKSELESNPTKYVPSMPHILKALES